MRNLSTWLVLGIMVSILNCSPIYNVSHEYDTKVDFTGLKTYNWPLKRSKGATERGFEDAINAQLETKGYRMTLENPDFIIDASMRSNQIRLRASGGGTDRYLEEMLVIRFMDVKSNKVLWKGEAMGMLNANYTSEELNELMSKAAKEILKEFPSTSVKWKGVQRSAIDITLQWDASTSAILAGYKIYYKVDSSGESYAGKGFKEGDSPIVIPLAKLNDIRNPRFTIHGLRKNTTYLFAVTAYSTTGEESPSSNAIKYSTQHENGNIEQ
jgi:hypothetical protein